MSCQHCIIVLCCYSAKFVVDNKFIHSFEMTEVLIMILKGSAVYTLQKVYKVGYLYISLLRMSYTYSVQCVSTKTYDIRLT